jgi:hypothetical protein
MDEREARNIGNNLRPCLKSRKISKAGVDMWRLQNRSVRELFEEFPWMKDLIGTVAEGVVKSAPWGMMFRVVVGAGTSMTDFLTDVYVTHMFWRSENYGYFYASLASLAASIVIQVVCVYFNFKKCGTRRWLREALPVFIGFKPALDAYYVAAGVVDVDTAGDATAHMTAIKVVEMFAEAIPGVIIQLMAIGTSTKSVDTLAWVSLVVSAISTGFIGGE